MLQSHRFRSETELERRSLNQFRYCKFNRSTPLPRTTFKLAGHAGHRSIWHRVLLEVLVLVPVGERVVPPRGLCYSVSTSARVAWRAMMGVIFDLVAICPRWLLSWIQCLTKDAHTQPNDVGLPRAKPHQQKRSRTVWRGQ